VKLNASVSCIRRRGRRFACRTRGAAENRRSPRMRRRAISVRRDRQRTRRSPPRVFQSARRTPARRRSARRRNASRSGHWRSVRALRATASAARHRPTKSPRRRAPRSATWLLLACNATVRRALASFAQLIETGRAHRAGAGKRRRCARIGKSRPPFERPPPEAPLLPTEFAPANSPPPAPANRRAVRRAARARAERTTEQERPDGQSFRTHVGLPSRSAH